MKQIQTTLMSLISRQRRRAARAFSSLLVPRIHLPGNKRIETSRSGPYPAAPTPRTMPVLATATPP